MNFNTAVDEFSIVVSPDQNERTKRLPDSSNTCPLSSGISHTDFFQVNPFSTYGVNSLSVFSNIAGNERFSFEGDSDNSFELVKRDHIQKKTSRDIFKMPNKTENSMIGEHFESTGITHHEKLGVNQMEDLNSDVAQNVRKADSNEENAPKVVKEPENTGIHKKEESKKK
mmetsp:Transcript_11976/g.11975  ORF Transcript_11976/g.11975 Transcript_11976/m.11975 type:complete len:170 (+) Transcript_11976:25-534(+)